MNSVLVFGDSGQISGALKKKVLQPSNENKLEGGFAPSNWKFVSSSECSFESSEQILKILNSHSPSIVINPAAYTAVDKAEVEIEKAFCLNAFAPGLIAKWCEQHKSSLIHFSTDYVYPGNGEIPWREDDNTMPLNQYGLSKLNGEKQIVESGCHYVILRTSWVYSPIGTNFVRTMLKLGSEREELKIVSDQVGSPTSAEDLAELTLLIMDNENFRNRTLGGIYHAAGIGFTSWFDFAKQVFAEAKALGYPLKIKSVLPILTQNYPTPAMRPLNSRLDQSKIEKDFGWQAPAWQDSLRKVIQILCK